MQGEDNVIPSLRSGVDLTRVSLTVEEAFVASRIDGRSTAGEIAAIIGKSSQDTDRILQKLASAGVISLGGAAPQASRGDSARTPPPRADSMRTPPPRAESRSAPSAATSTPSGAAAPAKPHDGPPGYVGYIFPLPLLQETCDLDDDTRKRVIWTHDKLSTWNYFELLQVHRKAEMKDIKKAYFDRSKEWHPDRFRRPNLGSFKKMIEAIYRQVNEAYKTLSDEEKRKEYAKTCVFEPDEEELKEMLREKLQEQRDARRDAEAKERRRRNNPIRQRLDRAKELTDQAVAMKSEGKLEDALRAAQMALTYDENNEAANAIVKRLKKDTAEIRVQPYLKRGQHFETLGSWDEALQMYDEAVRIAPNSGKAHLRLAYTLLMSGRRAEDGGMHAQRAVTLLPEEAEAHYVVGRYLETSGMEKLAKSHFEKAVELRPGYSEATKRLKRLKWGF